MHRTQHNQPGHNCLSGPNRPRCRRSCIRGPDPFSQELLRRLRSLGQLQLPLLVLLLLHRLLQLLPPPLLFLFLTLQKGFGATGTSRESRRAPHHSRGLEEEADLWSAGMPHAPHPAAAAQDPQGPLAAVHPKSCPSSVPVGQRAKPAPHHDCDEGLRTAQQRRSAARVAATSGAVAPAAVWRHQCEQHQPCRPLRSSEKVTQKGNAFELRHLAVCVVCSVCVCVCV